MRSNNPEILKVAERIAAQNGVSVDEVIQKFRRGVQKSAFSVSDFFWPDSDISLKEKKLGRPHLRAAV